MSGWTKRSYAKHVVTVLTELLDEHGFSRTGNGSSFAKVQSSEVSSSISVIVVSGKTAAATIELDVFAGITLRSVANTCEKLFGRDRSMPTIGAPIGRFMKVDRSRSTYRFTWNIDDDEQILPFKTDLLEFLTFSNGISSVSDLDAERLARIPHLRRNFSQGLGETYKYTVPEVAAVIHRLNSRVDRAVLALGIAETSGRLSEDQLARIKEFIRSDS